MRKIVLFLAVILPLSVLAQRPVQGMQSFTFGISGLQNLGVNAGASATVTLLYRKYQSDSIAHRYAASLVVSNSNTILDDDDQGMQFSTSNSSASLTLAMGFQNSLGGNMKVEPYYGVDFLAGYQFSNAQIERKEVISAAKTPDSTDHLGDFWQTENRMGMPLRLGVLPLVGVNYHFTDNLAIGAEFSYGIIATFASNGTRTFRTRLNGVELEPVTIDLTASNTTFKIGSPGSALLNLSVFF
jgi:hypothetical protein